MMAVLLAVTKVGEEVGENGFCIERVSERVCERVGERVVESMRVHESVSVGA